MLVSARANLRLSLSRNDHRRGELGRGLLIFGSTACGSAGLVSGSPGSLVVGGRCLAGWLGQQGVVDASEAGERGDELVGPGPAGIGLHVCPANFLTQDRIVTEAGGVAVLRRALNGQSWPGVPIQGGASGPAF